jgi:hypothetical protein
VPGSSVRSLDSRREFFGYDEQSPDSEITDHEALLFPSTIRCYDIETRMVVLVCLTDLHKVDWSKDAMNDLVLDKDKKQMIQDLLKSHITRASFNGKDIIQGKGLVSNH